MLSVHFDVKAISNLRPVWLGEKSMIDGKDRSRFNNKGGYWIAKDSLNPWWAVYGSVMPGSPVNNEGSNIP